MKIIAWNGIASNPFIPPPPEKGQYAATASIGISPYQFSLWLNPKLFEFFQQKTMSFIFFSSMSSSSCKNKINKSGIFFSLHDSHLISKFIPSFSRERKTFLSYFPYNNRDKSDDKPIKEQQSRNKTLNWIYL